MEQTSLVSFSIHLLTDDPRDLTVRMILFRGWFFGLTTNHGGQVLASRLKQFDRDVTCEQHLTICVREREDKVQGRREHEKVQA